MITFQRGTMLGNPTEHRDGERSVAGFREYGEAEIREMEGVEKSGTRSNKGDIM